MKISKISRTSKIPPQKTKNKHQKFGFPKKFLYIYITDCLTIKLKKITNYETRSFKFDY